MEIFIIKDQWENQEKDGRTLFGGTLTDRRNKRMEGMKRRQRKMEAYSEGGVF
jgi:hypothetical protein